jgi:tetratricopeptide (TPR) repeat protein
MAKPRRRKGRQKAGNPERAPEKRRKLALWQGVATSLIAVGLFFGLLEGILALAGVEPVLRSEDPFVGFASNVPLFVEETDRDGRKLLVTPKSKLVFFNQQRFPREKASGTYRIFCLGGSTTYGRPYVDATSFAGWLRELLPVADSGRSWEVINAGGISYASYRVAHLMEELIRYQPDLFIIYTGHNEFLEERTYGSLRDTPAAIRSTSALLARTRTWAAMSSLLNRQGTPPDVEEAGRVQLSAEVNAILSRSAGPELYERDDVLREQVLLHYQISLARMVDMARSVGADVVFVTPVSNLKDSTPFKSQHTDGLGEADQLRSEQLLSASLKLIRAAAWSRALETLDEALAIDPRFAELHYRRGRVLLALGRHQEAAAALRRARDEDVCPLRALSPMRAILAEVAREKRAKLVDFADLVERHMLAERGHRIPGEEVFLDHVHPTIAGNRMLAVALVQAMIDEGVVQPADTWGDAAISEVASRVEQGLDRKMHARALVNLSRVLSWAGKLEDASRLARQILESGVEDPELVVTAFSILATSSERQGDIAQARNYYRRALAAEPGSAEIHLKFGLSFLKPPGRDVNVVAAHVLLACTFWPENDMTHQLLGLAMAERHRYEVAYPSLLEALRLNPQNAQAESALARLRELLEPAARSAAPPKVTLTRYPSGAPLEVAQVRLDSSGRYTRHGILTEWYEDGELKRLLDYRDGVPDGAELSWDKSGRLVARAEYRHGKRTTSSGP